MKHFLVLTILFIHTAFAQGGYVGGGLGAADIPAFVVLGYNWPAFGVRLSGDTTFAGLEGYLRVQVIEEGSSFYIGSGIGLRPYALWVYQNRPPLGTLDDSEVPLSISFPIGAEFRSENVGFFLEYVPSFPISGAADFYDLIGLLHARLGVSYYF
jgi:hypothetical protein